MESDFLDPPAGNQAMVGRASHRASIRQQYQVEIEHLEKEVAKRRELLRLLDENPVIEKFIDLQRS